MSGKLYALVAGVNRYPSGIPSLAGCLNDARAVETYLRGLESLMDERDLRFLADERVTREALIDGFGHHLTQAGPEDVALFYFSGHGTQEPAPRELWHLEPDRLLESLVCWRPDGSVGLVADKELGVLIRRVAEKQPHIVVLLDCCHSGSGTREAVRPTWTARRVEPRTTPRPWDEFLREVRDLASDPGGTSGWGLGRPGRHVLMAACRAHEQAKETDLGGDRRGAFTYHLLEALRRSGGDVSYVDLTSRVASLVRGRVFEQCPLLEAMDPSDARLRFLGGAATPRDRGYPVFWSADRRAWVMDGGRIHGITWDPQVRPAVALFAPGAPPDATPVGTATLKKVDWETSLLDEVPESLERGAYEGRLVRLPVPLVRVHLEGEGVRALAPQLQSVLFEIVDDPADAVLLASEREGRVSLSRAGEPQPLAASIDLGHPEAGQRLKADLEHIARWQRVMDLEPPPAERLPDDAVAWTVDVDGGELREGLVHARCDEDHRVVLQVTISNRHAKPVYAAVLDLSQAFGIFPLLEDSQQQIAPGGTMSMEPMAFEIPEGWRHLGRYRDTLRLLVSEAPITGIGMLQQGRLEAPDRGGLGSHRGLNVSEIMGLLTRDPVPVAKAARWTAKTEAIVLEAPRPEVSLDAGGRADLGGGVTIEAHPLQAAARVCTAADASRDWRRSPVPQPVVEGLAPVTAADGATPLGVELKNVTDRLQVTPENPLRVNLRADLREGEWVLPVGFDGEFFLPLGAGTAVSEACRVAIDRLPEPVAEGTRSLGGAIKIFFYKAAHRLLGAEYDYPRLLVAEPGPDGTWSTHGDGLGDRVRAASRIAVLVHGIIGETAPMLPALDHPLQDRRLRDSFDLVLTFDYENLNTPIEQTATDLKDRLEKAGIGRDGRKVTMIAHSMGGLVSRTMIERCGGAPLVHRLIMLGTPNGGSPYPNLEAQIEKLIAMGINNLLSIPMGVSTLLSLAARLAGIKASPHRTTLEQMKLDSDFLKGLVDSPDPGVPYAIVAGDTSIRDGADPDAADVMSRLLKALHPVATTMLFGGDPNDGVVSLKSIFHLPPWWPRETRGFTAGCDHVTYFNDPDGVFGLSRALEALETS